MPVLNILEENTKFRYTKNCRILTGWSGKGTLHHALPVSTDVEAGLSIVYKSKDGNDRIRPDGI